jgi:hypothetical protein
MPDQHLGAHVRFSDFTCRWTFLERWRPLHDIPVRNLLTKRPIAFQFRIVANRVREQYIQIMNSFEGPLMGQQEPFQVFLKRLLKAKGGIVNILLRSSFCHPLQLFSGDAKPIFWVARLGVCCHIRACLW